MKRLLIALIAFFAFASTSNAQCDANWTYTNITCDSVWFVPASTGPQYIYDWNFGDGNSSSDPSPTHVYASDGTYTAYLVIQDTVNGCNNALTIPITIDCGTACSVNSAWTYYTDSLGCTAYFISTVSGTNNPYSYFWDFGDGGTSNIHNPNHTFNGPQPHFVCLTVTDALGCDTTMCDSIIAGCPPTSCDATTSFTYLDCDSVWFTTASSGPQYAYEWHFGDGNTSTDPNPIHAYGSDGTYTGYVVVQDTVYGCNDVFTFQVDINCGGSCGTVPNWTWQPDSCGAYFVAAPYGGTGPYTYYWDFGDGATSTSQNPTHYYSPLGAWEVCLTVTDANGCDSSWCQWITVGCAATSCDATTNYTHLACDSIWFATNSSGPQYSYEWHFGDGNTSTDSNPTHVYGSDGTYTGYVVVQDTVSGCNDVFTFQVTVNCGTSCTVNGAFAWNVDSSNCNVNFVSTAFGGSGNYSYFWNFGDGNTSTSPNPTHYYPNNSTWTPCLTITDLANGCDTTICEVVTVGCTQTSCNATFTHTNITCDSIWFYPASTGSQYAYYWDFGDGNTSTSQSPTHVYSADGLYIVELVISDTVSGCNDSFFYTISIDCNYSPCNTDGAFAWNVDSSNCNVNFVSTAFGGTPPYTFYWAFGDGNTSNLANPTHQYPNNSTWTPCLTITDANGCDTTICQVVTVACNSVNCDATHTHTHVSCDSVWFVPAVQDPSFDYYWDFGDGNFSTDISPVHPYASNGTYTVVLYISDSLNGCSHAYTTIVNVNCGASPCDVNAVTTWTLDSADCSVIMIASPWGGTPPYSYYWTFGDGNTSSLPSPSHQYPSIGPWTPCVTVTDTNGCDTTVCMIVTPQCTSGINEEVTFEIEVYPNPSSGIFNLLLPNDASINIFNLSGQLIYSDNSQKMDGLMSIDLSNVVDGIYILQVATEFGIATEKLVKD